MRLARRTDSLEDLLLAHRWVTEAQLTEARGEQRLSQEPLSEVVVRKGWVSEEQLLKVLAARAGVAPWNLKIDPPQMSAIRLLPAEVCLEHQMMPVQVRGDLLLLAMRDPQDVFAIETAKSLSGMRVEPMLASESRLRKALERLDDGLRDERNLDSLVAKAMLEVRERRGQDDSVALSEIDTRPVVGLVNQILSDAIRLRASDIHLEPRSNCVEVRYRLDGQLSRVQEFPRDLMPMVVARVKIMAELDIVEHRLPQDGRISTKLDNRDVDMRVSVLPNHHGPRVALRLLDRNAALRPITSLGFTEQHYAMFKRLIVKPYGLILVTGPTGSGKTTTLYAALTDVQSECTNIMTCEDPIEYDLHGINQSQVNEKVGLTFASQLRAILRQDPDVVLVGEIRDQETAEIAVRASMTGHLVLSTVHTNDAPSAIPRLLDIGVKPYLLGTSLIGVMAQRLVRRLCPHCKREEDATLEEAQLISATSGLPGPFRVWRPVGCKSCYGTGYRGREAIHEVMPVTGHMPSMISSGALVEELVREAGAHGYSPMRVDAIRRVLAGVISFEEASRTVFLDDCDFAAPQLRVA